MGGQDKDFVTDIKALRERARWHIKEGAITETYAGNVETACKVLNEALATEIVCVLRYKRHYFMAKAFSGVRRGVSGARGGRTEGRPHCGAHRPTRWRSEFLPEGLLSEPFEYVEGTTLLEMITEDRWRAYRHRQLSGDSRLFCDSDTTT